MALNCGIVGLPNVGKSTIFNALTAAKAQAANYPFCTIDPNVGIVSVPDERLDRIAAIVNDGVVLNSDLDAEVAAVTERLHRQIIAICDAVKVPEADVSSALRRVSAFLATLEQAVAKSSRNKSQKDKSAP